MSTESLKMEAPEASADAPCSPHKKQRKYVINQSDLKKRKESFSACSGPFGVVDAFLILVSLVAYLVDTLTGNLRFKMMIMIQSGWKRRSRDKDSKKVNKHTCFSA